MSVVDDILRSVHEMFVSDSSGAVANYIPELAAVDPDAFAIVVATADGFVYEVGQSGREFMIQSVSKPFTYALALADNGEEAVANKVDVEPSGEPFNEISLDPQTERPRNPMINAGAITAVSMVRGESEQDRFERIRTAYSQYAGRELSMNEQVYRSESRTGHRNRAIGHMLRSFDIITDDPDTVVDLYIRQCSIDVTCRDLAMMAATLANNGVNPATGTRVLDTALVERVLSVMTTCGMYDDAGDWVTRVGLPAKSGVGGAILAVLPGQLGIAVYSPRLDAHGNSVRGVLACREMSKRLELHFLHVGRAARSAVRAEYTVRDAPSRRRRAAVEQHTLDERGDRVHILELHGDMLFSAAESVVRAVESLGIVAAEAGAGLDGVVLDMRRVDDVGGVARTMLEAMSTDLLEHGCATALVDPDGSVGYVSSNVSQSGGVRVFTDLESATLWAEELILDRWCDGPRQPARIELSEHPVITDLAENNQGVVIDRCAIRRFAAGHVVVEQGDDPIGLALILDGRVTMARRDDDGSQTRIATLGSGMTFGEIALIHRTPFAVRIVAESDTTVALLTPEAFDRLTEENPVVKLDVLETLLSRAYGQAESIINSLRRPALPR